MELSVKNKILIVSAYAPPAPGGSGLMMFNILSHFPENTLSILTSDKINDQSLEKYRLKAKYYYYGNKYISLSIAPREDSYLTRIKRKLKDNLIIKFFLQIILFGILMYKIPRCILKIIKQDQIDNVIVYSDIGFVLSAVLLVSYIKKIKFSVHFYDLYTDNKIPIFLKLVSYIVEPRLFKRASNIFVMCEALKSYYENKYGIDCKLIYNSIILPDKIPVCDEKMRDNQLFKIIYVGSVYWAQIGAIKNIFQAVNEVDNNTVKLVLYTPHSSMYLNSCGIYANDKVLFSYCNPDNLYEVFKSADYLFLGLSFNSKYQNLINTSNPGKLCDYFISGRPIIINAPKDSYLASMAEKEDLAFVVFNDDVNELKSKLLILLNKPPDVKQKVDNAINYATKYMNAKFNYEKLMEYLK